jgi:hypothetical protein
MNLVLNILWFVLGGVVSGTLWMLAGLLLLLTVVGAPWAFAAFRIGRFSYRLSDPGTKVQAFLAGLVAVLLAAPAQAQAPVRAPAPCVGAKAACVVSTSPANGSQVAPGSTVLRVTFDRPMRQDGFSVTNAPGGALPQVAGQPRFLADGRTFELPLTLQPGTTYALSINSAAHSNFRGLDGAPAIPRSINFSTTLAAPALAQGPVPAPAPCVGAKAACVVSTSPANGSRVAPGSTILRVTFDRPMRQDGFSITNAPGGAPPQVAGQPRFLSDGRTFELPLALQPGMTYALSINSEAHRNFRGLDGAPAIPRSITFSTTP